MYIPKQLHYLGPAALVLLPYGVNRMMFGGGLSSDGLFWLVTYSAMQVGVEWAKYISGGGTAYNKFVTSNPTVDTEPVKGSVEDWHTGKPVEGIPFNNNGESKILSYDQVTTAPAFSAERNFYRTLRDQRNHNMKIDLTEAYWLDTGRYGESRDKFVFMKERGVRIHALRREGNGKNAKYLPDDWRVIHLIVQGEYIPG